MKRARPGQTESLGKFQWRHFDLFSPFLISGAIPKDKKNTKKINAKFASLGLAGVREGTKKMNLINIEKKNQFLKHSEKHLQKTVSQKHTLSHTLDDSETDRCLFFRWTNLPNFCY